MLFNNYGAPAFNFVRGEGSLVWDDRGEQYVDLASGIATSSLGHAHPKVLAAIQNQAQKFLHSSNLYTSDVVVKVAELLVKNTFADKVFFANSGAEVNEAAVKLARKYTFERDARERGGLVATTGAFHGRTMLGIALGANDLHRVGFGPLPYDIRRIPFNATDAAAFSCIDAEVAAVIVEPVQGESGIHPAVPQFLVALRQRCDATGSLLIFDEVQSGNGRTGALFAYESYGIVPDILTTAKGLAAGLPLGACLTTETIASAMTPGSHGSTFGGNPVSCAAAEVVLEEVSQPSFLEQVKSSSNVLENRLTPLVKGNSGIVDVRVCGLWAATDFTDTNTRDAVFQGCKEAKVLVLKSGDKSIRFAPPLNINADELTEGLNRFENALYS